MDNKALFVMILVLLLAVAIVQSFQLYIAKEKIREKMTGTITESAATEESLAQSTGIEKSTESEKAPDGLGPGQKINK